MKMQGIDWDDPPTGVEQCEVSNEPGEPCQKIAVRCIEEPWTPGCFRIKVCQKHVNEQIELGFYDRGPVPSKLTLGDAREMGGYDSGDLDGAGSWSGGPARFSK
jgi:hypothetical protein